MVSLVSLMTAECLAATLGAVELDCPFVFVLFILVLFVLVLFVLVALTRDSGHRQSGQKGYRSVQKSKVPTLGIPAAHF